jgi:hypothetical protein
VPVHFDPLGGQFIKTDVGRYFRPFLVTEVFATSANFADPEIDLDLPQCGVRIDICKRERPFSGLSPSFKRNVMINAAPPSPQLKQRGAKGIVRSLIWYFYLMMLFNGIAASVHPSRLLWRLQPSLPVVR